MANPRVAGLMEDLFQAVHDIVEKHEVTHEEYRAAVAFLNEVAEAGETMLLFDVFLEGDVVTTGSRDWRGTPQQALGPYYLEDAPWVEDGQLAGPEEEGDRLLLTGTVREADGSPIPGAVLDWWQSDSQGRYSAFDIPPRTNMNLRGRMHSKEDGSYALHTVVPAPYTIPHTGPTGRLIEALGWHPWRPAHLHLKASGEGFEPLVTQIYFAGDEYIESDVGRMARHDLALELRSNGDGRQADFDIVLEAAI